MVHSWCVEAWSAMGCIERCCGTFKRRGLGKVIGSLGALPWEGINVVLMGLWRGLLWKRKTDPSFSLASGLPLWSPVPHTPLTWYLLLWWYAAGKPSPEPLPYSLDVQPPPRWAEYDPLLHKWPSLRYSIVALENRLIQHLIAPKLFNQHSSGVTFLSCLLLFSWYFLTEYVLATTHTHWFYKRIAKPAHQAQLGYFPTC